MTPEQRSDGILISLNNWVEVPRDDAKFEQLREFLREAFRAAVRVETTRCAGIAQVIVEEAEIICARTKNKRSRIEAKSYIVVARTIADAIKKEDTQ